MHTVVLIGDERMLRELLAGYLRLEAVDLAIVEGSTLDDIAAEEMDRASVVAIMRRNGDPDVIMEEVLQAKQRAVNASIAIVSDFKDTALVEKAFEAGVNGFLSTLMSAKSLVHYVRLLTLNDQVISPRLLRTVFRVFTERQVQVVPKSSSPVIPAQELDVLLRLRRGKPNKLIGAELGISEGEVKARVRALMRRFGVHNRVQLVLATDQILGSQSISEPE